LHFICLPFIPFNYWDGFTHVILPTVYYYGVGLAESPFLLLKLVSMP
jgi:hypothetical protein